MTVEITMQDLSAFQRDLLYTVASFDEPKGVTIKNDIEDYYDADVNLGRLYPNLDELAERGLVEKGSIDRRANYYRLTPRGRRAIEARREWEAEKIEF